MSIFRTISFLGALSLGVAFPGIAGAVYDKDYIGLPETYRAVYEDTFIKIARDNDLGYVEMRAANPDIDPWIPGDGTKIILPKQHLLPDAPRDGIIINLPEMRLYYFPKKGAPETFAIGIGRDGLDTPTGVTKVMRKKDGPIWRPTPRMREEKPELPESVPPGPKNPLGTHALYLGWPEYLIHGTNKPYGIGRRVSSGCIRMYPEDIITLFKEVPIDTRVEVVDQPVKAGWIGDDFYIEVHPLKVEADFLEENLPLETTTLSEKEVGYILDKAGDVAERLDWPEIRKAAAERRGYPVLVASRHAAKPPVQIRQNR
ncbi:MAG: L,D-transpeptidase family protein [Rhodospirillales bacterium]|nr:L,D-transpeptidase family protein [Rhodospirillales bacterium]MCB9964641.1 L,D-transpeptidase family protein [Rhodospirillales bacterium]MCB9979931.1 L,D-transpeptidase family protein [Rhodospirillales bacterium]